MDYIGSQEDLEKSENIMVGAVLCPLKVNEGNGKSSTTKIEVNEPKNIAIMEAENMIQDMRVKVTKRQRKLQVKEFEMVEVEE